MGCYVTKRICMMYNNQLYLIVRLGTLVGVVTLLTCIWVMRGSSSDCYTDYPEVLLDSPQTHQAHTEILLQIVP